MPDTLHDLARDLDRFAADREWHEYHAPKNLASALIVEAGELLEHFQWMTEEQSRNLTPEKLAEVRGEMADVLLYLVQLGNELKIDLVAAGQEKLSINAGRFPVRGAVGTPPALRALRHGMRGDWQAAHEIVQDADDRDSAWVHAWLHRVEGDLENARYWYTRAGRPVASGETRAEGRAIASALGHPKAAADQTPE